jgi:hypothetical protein
LGYELLREGKIALRAAAEEGLLEYPLALLGRERDQRVRKRPFVEGY